MNLIHINEFTIDMITELNNGVRPELHKDTYFIWKKDEPAEIVSGKDFRGTKSPRQPLVMYYLPR